MTKKNHQWRNGKYYYNISHKKPSSYVIRVNAGGGQYFGLANCDFVAFGAQQWIQKNMAYHEKEKDVNKQNDFIQDMEIQGKF